jgi:hypothetical protein
MRQNPREEQAKVGEHAAWFIALITEFGRSAHIAPSDDVRMYKEGSVQVPAEHPFIIATAFINVHTNPN